VKIWQKILLGFLLVFVLISLSNVPISLDYIRILDSFRQIKDQELVDTETVQEMEKVLLEMDAFILKFYSTGDERVLRHFEDDRRRWQSLFDQIRGSLATETRFAFRLGRLKRATLDWMSRVEQAARNNRAGKRTALPGIEEIRPLYRELLTQQRIRLNESYDNSLQLVQQGGDLSWGLRALALAVGLIACLLVIRSVKGPLDRLIQAIERRTAGYFEPPLHASRDEIGQLTRAFNEMSRALKERTDALDEQRRVAVQASELKTEFLANTSHELRTPLNTIMGYSQLILDGLARTKEEERSYLITIRKSSTHLLSLINDVLDITRIESGQMQLDLGPVSVMEILNQVKEHMHLQAREKGLSFTVAEAEPDLCVQAHPGRLSQVLLNVVGNAIKFTHAGSVSLEAGSSPSGKQVHFTVRDTGIGISPEKQDRLFQKFVQGDGSMTRRFGGTGLGLALSKTLLGLMEGSIKLNSEGENKGTTVMIVLQKI